MYPGLRAGSSNGGVKSRASPASRRIELIFHSGHRACSAGGIGRPGDHAPGLGDESRSGIRRSQKSRMAFRHRKNHADTSCHPTRPAQANCPAPRHESTMSRRALAPREFPPKARRPTASRAGTSRARRSRPCPAHRPDSCRRSSHPCRSRVNRARRSQTLIEPPRAVLE